MHGSAPWKTQETIVGLAQLPVLSGFSRFGGCHVYLRAHDGNPDRVSIATIDFSDPIQAANEAWQAMNIMERAMFIAEIAKLASPAKRPGQAHERFSRARSLLFPIRERPPSPRKGTSLISMPGEDYWPRKIPSISDVPFSRPRQMFQEVLRLIAELRPPPPPAPAKGVRWSCIQQEPTGGVRPNAREDGQSRPSNTAWAAWNAGPPAVLSNLGLQAIQKIAIICLGQVSLVRKSSGESRLRRQR